MLSDTPVSVINNKFLIGCLRVRLPKNIAPRGRVKKPTDFMPYTKIIPTSGSLLGKKIGARNGAKNAYNAES